jgi:UrcA family protein
MTMKALAVAVTAAILATQLAAPTVSAEETRENANAPGSVRLFTLQVPLFDLDPATERGAKALYRRILVAAERVCMTSRAKRDGLRATRDAERHAARCFDDAVDAAVADVRALVNVDIEQLAGVDRYAGSRLSAFR